jgi:hypothetical protein
MQLARFAPGTQPTYDQWKQQRENQQGGGIKGMGGGFGGQQQQPGMSFEDFKRSGMLMPGPGGVSQENAQGQYQNYLNQQGGGFGGQQPQGRPKIMSPEMQDYYARDRAAQAERAQRMQGMLGGPAIGNIPGNPGFPDPRTRNQQPRQQPQQNMQGIQDLFSRMMGQFQQQQSPQQMPQFRSPALGYRPNMSQANAALSRVQPSVQKQQQDAQAARIAELEAQLAGYQTSPSNDFGGGG